MRIVITGVCASGKSTLTANLKELGYDAHNVAQEHSGVPSLWSKKNPDIVILLDANYPTICQRRQVGWKEDHLAVQRNRLNHVRQHADLYLPTDELTKEEVVRQVVQYIGGKYGNNYCRRFEAQ